MRRSTLYLTVIIFLFVCCENDIVKKIDINIIEGGFSYNSKYRIIFFVREPDCSGCIFNLWEWMNIFEKQSLPVHSFMSESNINNKSLINYNLSHIGIADIVIWDYDNKLEKQIDSLKLLPLIIIKNDGTVIKSFDPYIENRENIIENIKHIIENE